MLQNGVCVTNSEQTGQIVPYNGVTFISIVRFVISPMIPFVFRQIRLVISITFPLHEWAVFLVIDVLNLTYLARKESRHSTSSETKGTQNCMVPKTKNTVSEQKKKKTIWHEPKTVFYSLVSVVLINVGICLLWRHRFSEIFFSKVFAISSLTCSEYNSYKTVCTLYSFLSAVIFIGEGLDLFLFTSFEGQIQ